MAKKIRRIFAMCLALCLFVAVLPVNALAADTTETTTEGGITTTVETTTTTTTDESGKTTVTVIIDTTKTGTDETDAEIDYKETSTETTTTEVKEDGTTVITEQSSVVGSEVKEWDEIPEDLELPEELDTDVTVELIPGKTTEGSASDSLEFTEGDTDYTVTADKQVSAEAGEIETEVIENDYDLEALAPEDYEGKFWDNKEGLFHGNTQYTEDKKTFEQQGLREDFLENYPDGFVPSDDYYAPYFGTGTPDFEKPEEDGYDYRWTGYAEATNAARAESTDIVYAKDAITGEPILDEDGNYVIESTKLTGKYNDGLGSTPTIFTLTKYDEEGNVSGRYYGYCIDNDTEAVPSAWYQVSNLEDSDYYPTEDAADVLRAVVTNGYWGQEEGMGSLAYMKEQMLAYYDEDSTVFIKDKDGNMVEYNVYDVLYRLTEADALTATQAAIWSNSNGTLATQDGQDGTVITGIYSVVKPKSNLANCDRDWDYERDAVLQAAYEWLMSLEGVEAESVIINDQNFVEDMELVVGDKVEEPDETGENDVYEAAVNFTLAFIPMENDDLLMQLKYTDENGVEHVITKRLAGTNAEGEDYETIVPGEDGSYTIGGLQLTENQEFTFDLNLKGVQYLEQGVYIYQSYVSEDHPESQTMVGISEGTHDVSVKASMTVTFSVDEKSNVVAVREWDETADPTVEEIPPVVEDVQPVEEVELPPEPVFEVNVEDDTIEIPEEPVPLANAPKTGSDAIIWIALAIFAALGMAAVRFTNKKRQHETF